MISYVKAVVKTAAVLSLLASPALAQTISKKENAALYDSVKGWEVHAVSDGRGFNSCRAVRGKGQKKRIMLDYEGHTQNWRIMLRSKRPSGGGLGAKGAALYIDGKAHDRQVYFGVPGQDGTSKNFAKLDLSGGDLNAIKAGKSLRIDINGENSRKWSLAGVTAASLKVEECYANQGYKPAASQAAVSAKPKVKPNKVKPPKVAMRSVKGRKASYPHTINGQEHGSAYATVKDWNVYIMGDGRGLFACRAVRGHGYDDQIMLEYDMFSEGWRIMVPGVRPAGDGGGSKGAGVYYDGEFLDRQIYFGSPGYDGTSKTHAKLDLTEWELGKIKAGDTLRVDIRDEDDRSYSLAGSTAASLKVVECIRSLGHQVVGAPAPVAPTAKVAKPVVPAVVPQVQSPASEMASIGYVRFANGQYRATGGGNWVEEGDNGSLFYFVEYGRTVDGIFLNDASRNIQIWLAVNHDSIHYTQDFKTNSWVGLYEIMCAGRSPSRSC